MTFSEGNKLYDFIIIGGGPAGSTVATLLARKGFNVLVLEKEKFPRFHVGESLLPFCYHIFKKLGVLEQMESEFFRKPGVTFSNENNTKYSHWCFNHLIKDDSHLSFHVERSRFDDLLLQNSRINGAMVLEETKVMNVSIADNEELVNVHCENRSYQCRFVIDASGQDSFLGKAMKTRKKNEDLSPRIAVSTQWQNARLDETLKKGGLRIIHLEGEKQGWTWMIPIANNRLSVGVVTDLSYFKERKRVLSKESENWLEHHYLNEVYSSALGRQILSGATMLRELAINSDYSYSIENKFGNNHAVIGDASAFLDPMFASGVYLAMQSAVLVAEALESKFRDQDQNALERAYSEINGAYSLIEEMIKTYYNPEAIKFPEVSDFLSYNNQENIFAAIHFILAGDFFSNHKKYMTALEVLNSNKNIDRFMHLTGGENTKKTICA